MIRATKTQELDVTLYHVCSDCYFFQQRPDGLFEQGREIGMKVYFWLWT